MKSVKQTEQLQMWLLNFSSEHKLCSAEKKTLLKSFPAALCLLHNESFTSPDLSPSFLWRQQRHVAKLHSAVMWDKKNIMKQCLYPLKSWLFSSLNAFCHTRWSAVQCCSLICCLSGVSLFSMWIWFSIIFFYRMQKALEGVWYSVFLLVKR